MGRGDALLYAIAPLAHGVRRALGAELFSQPRSELLPRLKQTFTGADELKAALEDAFERSLQATVTGLKAPWLLMETGEKDYCESFSRNVREPFTQEAQIEGRLLIDFLDGFFLDYDTALDAAPVILGLPDTSDDEFFERILDAGESIADANDLAAAATATVREGFTHGVGLEEEHPIVKLSQWRELLADGLIFHFSDIARAHPSWSRYLDLLDEDRLARQDMRAAAAKDEKERARVAQARGLLNRIENYRAAFGEIVPNREWLFEIADRLEDSDETVESELLQGRPMLARELPTVVKAAVRKTAESHGVATIVRASDALLEPKASTIDVLRRARRDFRRCHWSGDDYAGASYELGALIFSVLGPRGAERYFREALAFQGAGAESRGACEYALFMAMLALEDRRAAIHHLQEAARANADAYEPFDMARYKLDAILGAGGAGMSFLVGTEEGKDLVVKTFWDEIAVMDPRPALKDLQTLVKAKIRGAAKIHHLCGYKKRVTFVVSDFIAGDDLESFREAQGGEAPARVVAEIGGHAADVLALAHDAGVLHRNVKPGNVRVGAGENGLEVTLLDFCVPNYVLVHPDRIRGIRRLAAWSRLGRQIAEDLATYTAPEVVKGGLAAATVQADLYSLGAVLYRLATGALARRVDPEGVPVEIRDIIVRCLARTPEERPGSAAEVAEALRQARERLDDASHPTGTLLPPDLPRPAKELTESQEIEFGLANLNTVSINTTIPEPDFLGPDVSEFGAPPADPFTAPDGFEGLPAADPFAPAAFSPGQADPFAAPGDPFGVPATSDPFAAPADPFGAPATDPFGAPADPFGAPATADPFAPAAFSPGPGPGADPFAPPEDPFAAPGDPFAPGAADPFAPGADPFGGGSGFAPPTKTPSRGTPRGPTATPSRSAPRGPTATPSRSAPRKPPAAPADPFGPASDPFTADPFAPSNDPFAAPAVGGAPAGASSAFDPFGGPNALDPFAPTVDGEDPFAGAGTGVLKTPDPFTLAKPATPRSMPRPQKRPGSKTGSKENAADEIPLDPSDALALLESLMHKKGGPAAKKKGVVAKPGKPAANPPAAAPTASEAFGAGTADPFAPSSDPFAPVSDPFAPMADPFAPMADPFAPVADPFGASPQPAPNLTESQQISDPLAGGAAGGMFFSNEGPAPGASTPELALPDELPIFAASDATQPAIPAAPPPGAQAKASGASKKGAAKGGKPAARAAKTAAPVDEQGYGLMVSTPQIKSKKEAMVAIMSEVCGISKEEAYDRCRAASVPVLKQKTKEEVEAAAEKFKAAKIQCRVTQKKERR